MTQPEVIRIDAGLTWLARCVAHPHFKHATDDLTEAREDIRRHAETQHPA